MKKLYEGENMIPYEILDYNSFYDSKYKTFNGGEGIGATGVLTTKQMVTRWNAAGIDKKLKQVRPYIGSHHETELKIIREIYGFDSDYSDENIHVLEKYTLKELELLQSPIYFRFVNSQADSRLIVSLPFMNPITSNQIEVLYQIEESLKKYKNKNIIISTAGDNGQIEANNTLIPVIEEAMKFIDNSYIPEIEDKNIIVGSILKESGR